MESLWEDGVGYVFELSFKELIRYGIGEGGERVFFGEGDRVRKI